MTNLQEGRAVGYYVTGPDSPPSIGQVVHYQSYGTPGGEFLPEPRAAIITEVGPAQLEPGADPGQVVGLAVLNPNGMYFNQRVPFSDEPKPGHWNWPPRV